MTTAAIWVTGILAISALGICFVLLAMMYRAAQDNESLRLLAYEGKALLIEPINEGEVVKCSCGSGLFAGYAVSAGQDFNGLGCVQCVSRRPLHWLLRQQANPVPIPYGAQSRPKSNSFDSLEPIQGGMI